MDLYRDIIAKQILESVKYLHIIGIVHSDVKVEKVLLIGAPDYPTVRLSDFGSATFTGTTIPYCGTKKYTAPEAFSEHESHPTQDIWSLGITLLCLKTGSDEIESLSLIPKRDPYRKIIRGFLNPDPNKRKTINWALDILTKEITRKTHQSTPLYISPVSRVKPFRRIPISPVTTPSTIKLPKI